MSPVPAERLADTLVKEFDLVDFLGSLTAHAAEVSGTAAVGLLLADHRGHLRCLASSEESARLLELFVLQSDEGPCRDCFAGGEPVVVPDLRTTHARWPVFAPRAMGAGFLSVCAVPMRHRQQVIGALTLFDTRTEQFTVDTIRVVTALANVATIGILQERAVHSAGVLTEQLRSAFSSRVVIEQAKGVLAQRHGTDVDTAFEQLRGYSRRHGLRLGVVAQDVVDDPRSHRELTGPGR